MADDKPDLLVGEPVKNESEEPVEWVFDVLPASKARRGGEPSSHAFRQNIATFVREVIQNANDQALGHAQVHFRFHELEGDALEEFKAAAGWPSLEPHLRAAAETKGGRNLAQYLAEFDERQKLVLLRVEDRGTVGLTGDELEGESHFRALCKDTLFSHKQSAEAGGSYGLGKSVLWAFSGLSTVLFNSTLSDDPTDFTSPRLIGRTELPSHAIDGDKQGYSGAGWFGRRVDSREGVRAESVWSERAEELAARLNLERGGETGTTLQIVGFRDPTQDEESSIEDLGDEIQRAAERFFWPALSMPGRPLVVWVVTPSMGGRLLDPKGLHRVAPFVDCYAQRDSQSEKLENPGDVVCRDIPIELPGRTDGGPAVKGRVRLCVRLADEKAKDELVGHVAMFRGPGMVVKYWKKGNIALGARPFYAVLACGTARHPEEPSPQDLAIEHFLRAAEPPGHDEWQTTGALKAEYKRGYKKALDSLHRQVHDTLRELVVPKPKHGTTGPDLLRKRFPIGRKGGKGSEPSAFHFSGLTAHFRDRRWYFEGTVEPSIAAESWSCLVKLVELGEDGRAAAPVPIERLTVTDDAETKEVGPTARVVAAPGAKAISFTGVSAPLAGSETTRGVLSLEVTGTTEP
jgi:hypothetical protein